ncbi:hypothetical protein ACFSTE_12320 [Aquimarina hainanensis]|uniref:Uncharacterized protein n=1 Tax=Aquimarina hainanensis TaxID=1578017 RepID=A0ABW5N9Q1_9FLAO|nr:hypothetical protein [Aquimarina sp. TRL1]QKX03792.1 hypothetical protein HN014_02275 [Aquimarina sp. TRL1]
MKRSNRLFISHEEAKMICDKNQYGEASLLEIIKLNIRLIFCALTRAYSKKNGKLSDCIKKGKPQTLCKEQKEVMKKNILEKMNE